MAGHSLPHSSPESQPEGSTLTPPIPLRNPPGLASLLLLLAKPEVTNQEVKRLEARKFL